MSRAGHTEQTNLPLLLQAVKRVSQIQEGISIPQRRLLEYLAGAPSKNGGWVLFGELQQYRNEAPQLVTDDLTRSIAKGLAERQEERTHKEPTRKIAYRITAEGVDLLALIEDRELDSPLLQGIKALNDRRRWATGTTQSVFQVQLQQRVLDALRVGRRTRTELQMLLCVTDHQCRYAVEELRAKGKVYHVGQGIWSLAELEQEEVA